ncbi:hypothetical protein BASA50_003959 [Batrachochytrium salamandrivorans]|uniref:Uncharacterized protein n=1 Tax=Batrachochytrium salamandrivorans TaxID=1357716 RepID=A0ABQ8FJQ5_9FUNG|nr:hypothetical protein BASA62_005917 [Batrachochytrium salamandrivorans]KAH6598076.1 hypothetical protein BASA50_003959 [Batrachochytrium salamandrivorans]
MIDFCCASTLSHQKEACQHIGYCWRYDADGGSAQGHGVHSILATSCSTSLTCPPGNNRNMTECTNKTKDEDGGSVVSPEWSGCKVS